MTTLNETRTGSALTDDEIRRSMKRLSGTARD